MKLGLVCADRGLRQLAVGRLVALPGVELDWYVEDAAHWERQPAVAGLLAAAAQCTPALLAAARQRGLPVLALVRTLARDCEALYGALEAGASAHVELELLQGAALAERLDKLWRHVRPAPVAPAPLIAIGASAGGPQALRTVLSGLPAALPAAVLVVQHFEGERVDTLCRWLVEDGSVALPVQTALAGTVPQAGCVHLAEGGRHLELDDSGVLRQVPRQAGDLHCPSVDHLFLSLAAQPRPGQAVLLTGMGRDGAAGLLALKRCGWRTLVQDAASSAVDGMPRAARELDAATLVVPLGRIAGALHQALHGGVPA